MSIHVVTGATGFVGSAVILELLRQTDVEVIGIVRCHTRPVGERLYAALENAQRAYGYEDGVLRAARKRCHAMAGDVTANATPPTVSELLFSIFKESYVKLALVESRKHFSWIDQKFDQGIEFYCSYLVGPKIFDRAHTDAVEENAVESSFGLDRLRLRPYVRWYLNLLAVKRPHLLDHR